MNNLSLDQLKYGAEVGDLGVGAVRSVCRELLALREAGKEPVAWEVKGILCHTLEEAQLYVGEPEPLYAAPQLPAVPEYPELLPCPVLLEPGFRFGKGVPTSSMLGALKRRAERQAELDAMSPEAKAEYDASIEKLKSVLMPDGAEQRLAAAVDLLKQSAPHMLADESLKDPDGALCGKVRSDGWSESASANAITVMLDRIETIDPADDDRIEEIKGLVRVLVAMKIPFIPDQLTIDDATAKLSVEYSLSNTGVTGFRDGWNSCLSAIAAAPNPE